jgi:tricorn protease
MDHRGYLRYPTIHGDTVAFVSEDDLWSVALAGGDARRLTTNAGEITTPRFSPDGTQLAFVGRDEGHPEVYLMPAAGGVARRLTYLGSDVCYISGWSADGTTIYFASDAGSPFSKETKAFAIAADGGTPRELELGHAMSIAIGAAGATVIGRNAVDPARWKRYRGGTAGELWIDAAGTGTYARLVPELRGNVVWPMLIGERVYFLSDHDGIANIYSTTPSGDDRKQHTHETTYFARFPATDGTRIVYTAGADLVVLDTRDDSVRRIDVQARSSASQAVRRFIEAGEYVENFAPSPDGTNVTFIARGAPFTMPLWEEAVTFHGETSDTRFRRVVWMHDGKRIAYVEDSAGYERIAIGAADRTDERTYRTTEAFGRIDDLVASPVDDTLAFTTHRHEVVVLVAGESAPRIVDMSPGDLPSGITFSPDGRWLAYAWSPASHASVIRIVEVATGEVHTATSLVRVDYSPAWDPDGDYLYLLSMRDFHPVYDALQFDLSFPQAARPYVVALRRDVPNPLVAKPQSLHGKGKDDDADDEGDDDGKDEKPDKKAPKPVEIDFDGITGRIIGLPVDPGNYDRLVAARKRVIFSQRTTQGIRPNQHHEDEGGSLLAYDFETQRGAALAHDVDDFALGNDHRTLLYMSHERMRAIDAGADLPDDEDDAKPPTEMTRRTGWLDLSRASVLVEPQADWAQMFAEAWRLQREQFWDETMSGVDWDAVYERYAPLLPRLRTRSELSDLIWEMQGELGTSHAYEIGGDYRVPPQYRRGFLGADYTWDASVGGYRITAILRGDSWDRDTDSPLAEPGVDVRIGDAIVSVGGRAVSATLPPEALLVNMAGRDVALGIVRDGERKRALVRALRDERMLRYRAWVEANRAIVHEKTNGKVGYLHIPDMGPWGFSEFHRGYLSEFERDGLIVDVRYNRGGHVSPLLLEKLARKRVGYDVTRWGNAVPYPPESVAGPMVAITNQFAGSDGDIFSHCFKLYGLGPLVGKRTWGGVIGINPYHHLVDGTVTTQPEYSFWFSDVGWQVENYGTDPTHEVDIAPHESAAGIDPQMDKALELMAELRAASDREPKIGPRPKLTLP